MPNRQNTPSDLRPLTSLRFAAAFMILLHHTQGLFPWGEFARVGVYSQGVSFFFVLSGFILTHVYSARPTGTGRFLLARAARLWPVHLVTLVLVFVLLRPDSRQLPGEGFFDPRLVLVANILLLHSIVPYVNYVFSWNSPSWSISTEWFFYLMFPLLLKDIHRTWPWKLALFAAIIGAYGALFALFEIPAYSDPQDLSVMFLAYSSPLFRGFEFVLGMASYVMWQTLNRRVIGRAAATGLETAAVLVIVWWALSGFWAGQALAQGSVLAEQWYKSSASCLVCAGLIVAVAAGRGPLGWLLSRQPLVWLGEISFSLYMVHQIIMKAFFLAAVESRIEPASPLVVFPVCILAGAALHHFVEKPARTAILRRAAPAKRD